MTTIPSATRSVLDGIAKQFNLSDTRLQEITKHCVADFSLGLSKYSQSMAMIPTYVTGVPDGTEKGTFIAVDLDWTTVRVSEVILGGQKNQVTMRHGMYPLTDGLKNGEATALFDFIAESVNTFLKEKGIKNIGSEPFKLGLAFSFPVEKTSLGQGKLLAWTKGYSTKNAVGKDIVVLLQDALNRKRVPAKCNALVNDTVATLLSQSYVSGGCFLGAIFGTGTNGAYVEQVANITKLRNSPAAALGGNMVVNTEWGAFNNTRTVLPHTHFDNKLDRESIDPRSQAFEKLISGMYLGEVTRNVILSLVDHDPPLLFKGLSTPALNALYGFDSQFMAMIEAAKSLTEVKQVLVDYVEFGVNAVTDQDAEIVRWVCELVGTRAAKLGGCVVAATLIQGGYARLGGGFSGGQGKIVVAADGNLIRFYTGFEARLRRSLAAVVGKEVEQRVEINIVKDGNALGAALCAYEATKVAK